MNTGLHLKRSSISSFFKDEVSKIFRLPATVKYNSLYNYLDNIDRLRYTYKFANADELLIILNINLNRKDTDDVVIRKVDISAPLTDFDQIQVFTFSGNKTKYDLFDKLKKVEELLLREYIKDGVNVKLPWLTEDYYAYILSTR